MTMIKYTLLIVVITHLWACMIRLIGDTPDCVKYYASSEIPGANPPDWYNTDSEGDCWLATVRYRKKGLWFEYVAALEWAAKAMGGESESITFGESFLGFLIMLSGMVMTAFLIGEIANVLTNFDPALNDYRTSMDNLNQYMLERNINKGLQKHLTSPRSRSSAGARRTVSKAATASCSSAPHRTRSPSSATGSRRRRRRRIPSSTRRPSPLGTRRRRTRARFPASARSATTARARRPWPAGATAPRRGRVARRARVGPRLPGGERLTHVGAERG
jgi:hypothetical protein